LLTRISVADTCGEKNQTHKKHCKFQLSLNLMSIHKQEKGKSKKQKP